MAQTWFGEWNDTDIFKAKTFTLADSPPMNLDTSVVAVLSRTNRYLPIRDEHFMSNRKELFFLTTYLIVWPTMIYITYNKESIMAYVYGFLIGIILIIAEVWSYNLMTWVYVDNENLRAYSVNFPTVKNIKKGELGDHNYSVSQSQAQTQTNMEKSQDERENQSERLMEPTVGDYKILVKNQVLPINDDDIYLISASDFIKLSNEGLIEAEDLGDYLGGQFKHEFGYANQVKPFYATEKEKELTNAAFFIMMICITWAMYTSRTKWASYERLAWIIGSSTIGLLTGGLTYSGSTVRSRIDFLYLMRRFLIICIAFSVTAILI